MDSDVAANKEMVQEAGIGIREQERDQEAEKGNRKQRKGTGSRERVQGRARDQEAGKGIRKQGKGT